MEAPVRRHARFRATSVVLAVACALLLAFSPAAHADPAESSAPPDPTVSTEPPPVEVTTEPPTPQTTTEPPPVEVTTDPPPKARKLTVTVSDVVLGDPYWQGDGSSKLVISLQNLGEIPETVTGSYIFPQGTDPAPGSYGTDGCSVDDAGKTFRCALDPGNVGYAVVKVQVAADAWRLSGGGKVFATMQEYPLRERNFSIYFSTKPPVPGIELSADPLALPAQVTPHAENGTLQVKLRNTGSARAGGAVEVVTPAGVDVVTFPSVCRTKRKISPERDRCELGDIPAGKDVSASFGLSITPAARAEVPLTGAVHGFLTPIGREPIETRTDYRITGPPLAGESPLPTEAPASPAAAAATTTDGKRQRAAGGMLTSKQLSSLPFVGGIVGLVALGGFLVVFSLRRRLRDDPDGPVEPDGEPLVTVPARRASDEDLPVPLPRSPIPRSLTLPRLPSGPVAGSGFRESEE